jgi:hypothetical protein
MIHPKSLDLCGAEPAARWLRAFQCYVRAGDVGSALALFSEEVVAFGTIAESVVGLDELDVQQWRKVWNQTCDFTFETDSVISISDPSSTWFTVTARWSSLTRWEPAVQRGGRCTIVLVTDARNETGLIAVHSHFSKTPDGLI